MGKSRKIAVHCAYTEMADPTELRPNPRNPNTHPDSQLDLLEKIIREKGWRAPITVSSRSGYIVRGHARHLVAVRMALKEVPVDRQDYATDEDELADLVADNRIAELAEMNRDLLKDLLQGLDTGAYDMDFTGFASEALEGLFTGWMPPASSGQIPSALPDPGVAGPDDRSGRFMLVYTTAEEKEFWCGKLGIPSDTQQVVFLPADL